MPNQNRSGRLAVILYGPLRTAEETAASLLRHVCAGRDASIFYFGPASTDAPGQAYRGQLDVFGTFKNNPKADISQTMALEQDAARAVYGERLRAYRFHQKTDAEFLAEAEAAISQADWLMKLNPYRMFSMFYNIEGGVRLMLEHEERTNETFDEVIITRPDLAFYTAVSAELAPGEIHVPEGEGVNVVGAPHGGNAQVFFYKNVATGDFVPGGGEATFNDQLFWFKRADLAPFLSLVEALPGYLKARVPPSPETILYLHLIGRAGLEPVAHPEWVYEIHRSGSPLIRNLTDTPEINMVDRRHPSAIALRRQRPIYSLLRDCRWLARKVVRKFIR